MNLIGKARHAIPYAFEYDKCPSRPAKDNWYGDARLIQLDDSIIAIADQPWAFVNYLGKLHVELEAQ